MQNVGITTKLRDTWEDAVEDSVIDLDEQREIAALVAEADDSVRLSLTILKVGDDSRDTKQRMRAHERLHGPIDIRPYQRRRVIRRILRYRKPDTKQHCPDCTPDSAA